MIIKQTVMSKDHKDRFFYKESLFSGVALVLNNEFVIDKIIYKNGVVVGNYKNPYFSGETNCLHIETSAFDNEYDEPCTYNGNVFSGIAYSFNKDVCIAEKEYEYGFLGSIVTYDTHGNITHLEVGDNIFHQKYTWHENKKIANLEIYEKNHFQIDLEFDENQKIKCLWINGDYFDRIDSIKDKIHFHLFHEKEIIEKLTSYENLYISGSAIDDNLLTTLIFNAGLSEIRELRIAKTSLSLTSINYLANCSKLAQLYIESNTIKTEELKNLKFKMPNCSIELNRQEVIL